MEPIKKLIVPIQLGAEDIEVGELVSDTKAIYFKYYPSFLNKSSHLNAVIFSQ